MHLFKVISAKRSAFFTMNDLIWLYYELTLLFAGRENFGTLLRVVFTFVQEILHDLAQQPLQEFEHYMSLVFNHKYTFNIPALCTYHIIINHLQPLFVPWQVPGLWIGSMSLVCTVWPFKVVLLSSLPLRHLN